MRRLLLAALFLSLCSALSAAPAFSATVNCGDVITADTTLTADLTGCTGVALTILGDGITLNLGGHTVSGVSEAGSIGIQLASTNSTLTNGTVEGFEKGIYDSGSSTVSALNTVSQLVIRNNGAGIYAFLQAGETYSHNLITHNGVGVALRVFKQSIVSDNTITANTGYGVYGDPDTDATFANNLITGNGSDGFHGDSAVVHFHNNVLSGNGGDGLYLNTLYPSDCFADVFQDNTANRNAGHGIEIHIQSSDPLPVCTYDQGGNKASYNRTEPQCINISCATETDTTPPLCKLIATNTGPPKRILVAIEDAESGLQDVTVTTKTNADVDVGSFATGTTDTILVNGTKLVQALQSVVDLRVTDVAGNVTECDPVIPGVKKTVRHRHNRTR